MLVLPQCSLPKKFHSMYFKTTLWEHPAFFCNDLLRLTLLMEGVSDTLLHDRQVSRLLHKPG